MPERSRCVSVRTRTPSARLGVALALLVSAPAAAVAMLGAPSGSGVADALAAAPSASASAQYDPNNTTGISKFMEMCLEGNRKYLANDYDGALETYRSALRLSPRNPFGHYLVAEAHLAAGRPADAEAALKQAEQMSDLRSPLLRSKVLFLLADARERQQKWLEAQAAWRAYSDWAMKHVDGGGTFTMNAAARVRVLDEAIARERSASVVRERIDASASGLLFNELAEAGGR
jgi:tetratricopeptide (TPR) repeat protein